MRNDRKWNRVIILGGGISGLLAADVLSNQFDSVVIFEKDKIEQNMNSRWGVPQGNHIHIILTAAVKSLRKRFPDMFSKMEDAGSVRYQVSKGLKWYHYGNWKIQFEPENELITYAQTRPVLEYFIRNEVMKAQNIQLIDETKVKQYLYDIEDNRINGVRIQNNKDNTVDEYADFVVDATGRSSKTIKYFKELGIDIPKIDTIDINLKYVSTFFSTKNNKINDFPLQVVYPKPPHSTKYGVIGDVEGDKVVVTLMGITGDHLSTKFEEFLKFARDLDHSYIYDRIKDLKPIAPIRSYAYPRMRRIYFDKMKQLPDNFLAIGDAICSFDPIFGQGMTVATLETDILEQILESTRVEKLSTMNQQFFNEINPLISDVWNIVLSEDTRYDIEQDPTFTQKIYQKITNQIYKLHDDKYVTERFYKVLNLEKRPYYLLHPKVIWKILKKNVFG